MNATSLEFRWVKFQQIMTHTPFPTHVIICWFIWMKYEKSIQKLHSWYFSSEISWINYKLQHFFNLLTRISRKFYHRNNLNISIGTYIFIDCKLANTYNLPLILNRSLRVLDPKIEEMPLYNINRNEKWNKEYINRGL